MAIVSPSFEHDDCIAFRVMVLMKHSIIQASPKLILPVPQVNTGSEELSTLLILKLILATSEGLMVPLPNTEDFTIGWKDQSFDLGKFFHPLMQFLSTPHYKNSQGSSN
ncbi:hypothetical protein Tco_0014138 [Tanacetum coccineum]